MSRRAWLAFGVGCVAAGVAGSWLNPLIAAAIGIASMLAAAALLSQA